MISPILLSQGPIQNIVIAKSADFRGRSKYRYEPNPSPSEAIQNIVIAKSAEAVQNIVKSQIRSYIAGFFIAFVFVIIGLDIPAINAKKKNYQISFFWKYVK